MNMQREDEGEDQDGRTSQARVLCLKERKNGRKKEKRHEASRQTCLVVFDAIVFTNIKIISEWMDTCLLYIYFIWRRR